MKNKMIDADRIRMARTIEERKQVAADAAFYQQKARELEVRASRYRDELVKHVTFPPEAIDAIMDQVAHKFARAIVDKIEGSREDYENLMTVIQQGMFLRHDREVEWELREQHDTSDMHVTVYFPELCWTQVADQFFLEKVVGLSGPAHAPNRQIHYMSSTPEITRVSYGTDPYEETVSEKVL